VEIRPLRASDLEQAWGLDHDAFHAAFAGPTPWMVDEF